MRIPPATIALRVVEEGRTKFRIWFPLFLLWPLLLVLLAITLIISLVADLICLMAGVRHAWTRLVVAGMEVLGETRGTDIFVENYERTVALKLH